jgi:hypothetical protein
VFACVALVSAPTLRLRKIGEIGELTAFGSPQPNIVYSQT